MQTSSEAVGSPLAVAPSPGADMMRGRTRDRSHTRSAAVKSTRAEYENESSTLRGRSRQRASSPFDISSRNPSSSVLSPTRHLLIHNRLRDSRRQHCPSRAPSPSGADIRRRRTRSRSRGPRSEREALRTEACETTEARSGLRIEVHVDEEGPAQVAQATESKY